MMTKDLGGDEAAADPAMTDDCRYGRVGTVHPSSVIVSDITWSA